MINNFFWFLKRVNQFLALCLFLLVISFLSGPGCSDSTGLDDEEIPLDFSKIRIAEDPLNATAKGALIAAMNEN